MDHTYFIEWEVVNINSNCIVITFLFDWISLIFIGFVFFISSLVILYRDDYIHGDYNINSFNYLVLLFVMSIIVLISSLNMITIVLGWNSSTRNNGNEKWNFRYRQFWKH